jgi:hypothetical protein
MRWRAASANLRSKGGDEMPPIATLHEPPSCVAVMRQALEPRRQQLIVYAVDLRSTPDDSFGEATFLRREDAERFIEGIRDDDPERASYLRIEERELGHRSGETPSNRSASSR